MKQRNYTLTGNHCATCGNPLAEATEHVVDGEYYCSLCDPNRGDGE